MLVPWFYSAKEPDLNVNGNVWPLNNVDNYLSNARCFNGVLSSSASPHMALGHNKEAVKLTILKQEALFRSQVHELHRLYWRQKGLMEELRATTMHDTQYRASQSNPFLSQGIMDHMPKEQACLASRCDDKKFGNKVLDLELPAYICIDSDDEGSGKDKFPAVPEMPTCSVKRSSEVLHRSDKEFHRKCFVDLNKPVSLEEYSDQELRQVTDKNEVQCGDVFGPGDSYNQDFSSKRNDLDACYSGLKQGNDKEEKGRASYDGKEGRSLLNLNVMPPDQNLPLVGDSDLCTVPFWNKCEPERYAIAGQASPPNSEENLVAKELVAESTLQKNISVLKFCIDLNACIDEDANDSSLPTPSDPLKAPTSPENKDSTQPQSPSSLEESDEHLLTHKSPSPPITDEISSIAVESDKNQPEFSSMSLEEEDRIGAESLIKMSSSCGKTNKAASADGCLDLFANIASSVVDNPNKEYGLCLVGDEYDHSYQHQPDEMDYFEAMTLQLPESKEDEYCPKTEPTVPSKLRKGRSRRRKAKNFQTEILPSLASLSRTEVTEDLQRIRGLTVDACSSRKALGRGKRHTGGKRHISDSENIASSVSQDNYIEKGKLLNWGNITKRQRGRRNAAVNPRLIIGQV